MSAENDLKNVTDALRNGEGAFTEKLPSGTQFAGSGDKAILSLLEKAAGNLQAS